MIERVFRVISQQIYKFGLTHFLGIVSCGKEHGKRSIYFRDVQFSGVILCNLCNFSQDMRGKINHELHELHELSRIKKGKIRNIPTGQACNSWQKNKPLITRINTNKKGNGKRDKAAKSIFDLTIPRFHGLTIPSRTGFSGFVLRISKKITGGTGLHPAIRYCKHQGKRKKVKVR